MNEYRVSPTSFHSTTKVHFHDNLNARLRFSIAFNNLLERIKWAFLIVEPCAVCGPSPAAVARDEPMSNLRSTTAGKPAGCTQDLAVSHHIGIFSIL